MTDETKHTESDLAVREGAGQYSFELIGKSPRGKDVVVARVGGGPQFRAGNAARLAHCWNCHDDLVAALEKWDRWIKTLRFNRDQEPELTESVDATRAAIGRARGA